MKEMLKNFLYTGVGFVSVTTDKLKKTIDKLVEEGKISAEENKKIMDQFIAKTKDKTDEITSNFETIGSNLLSKAQYASRKEFDELQKKLEELEKNLNKPTDEEHAV